MRYEISIDGTRKKVVLDRASTAGKREVFTGSVGEGKAKRLEILKSEANLITVSLDEKVYTVVQLKRGSASVTFTLDGRSIEASNRPPSTSQQEGYSSAASTNEVVTSNFPAKIVKISARNGDTLKEGDTLIVLEAMKMEAQIRVPGSCRVQEIMVSEGEMVERGKVLARLKFL